MTLHRTCSSDTKTTTRLSKFVCSIESVYMTPPGQFFQTISLPGHCLGCCENLKTGTNPYFSHLPISLHQYFVGLYVNDRTFYAVDCRTAPAPELGGDRISYGGQPPLPRWRRRCLLTVIVEGGNVLHHVIRTVTVSASHLVTQ